MSPVETFLREPGDTTILQVPLCQDIPVQEDLEAEGIMTTEVRGNAMTKAEEGLTIPQGLLSPITGGEALGAHVQDTQVQGPAKLSS